MPDRVNRVSPFSRRTFLRSCSVAAVVASTPALKAWDLHPQTCGGRHQFVMPLNDGWLFGGKMTAASESPGFNDSSFPRVTLPHCVTPLSWQNWNPSTWENVWIYRRHFQTPSDLHGMRIFLHFDRVMAGARPTVNGHALPEHLGGFLPFEHEVTSFLNRQDNVLSVAVDSRWLNVPPAGSPRGPGSVDYLLPGGISGSVSLRAVPTSFIRDVFARPVNVLDRHRQLEIACCIDNGASPAGPLRIVSTLLDGTRTIATASKDLPLEKPGPQELKLTLGDLQNVTLWSVENPHLYQVRVTLYQNGEALHTYSTRIGFRDARFELDGFFLNGRRLQIFGLNRHELYPYVGFSAPERILRRDAEILRHKFNCNFVRCSHYPQSEAFLDACDELGLMVWEEIPGWQYLGDARWQDLAVGDVAGMVRRDRNHPSIVVWGVRVNESANSPELYRRTREMAKSLDNSRPTSGTMTPSSLKNWRQEWHQDVFAFDDYHAAPDGSVGIREPLPGVPYVISEAVGQFDYGRSNSFHRTYRRVTDPALQSQQALLHAQAHNRAAADPRCAGVIAWCAFDYSSLVNSYDGVKYPGVADVFRIPKLGASFYLAQVDPRVRPVIEPDFYWNFGAQTPTGPGERAAIFSNCDRLELSIGGRPRITAHPDRAAFPNLKYPPFFADLHLPDQRNSELRIDGYVGERLALSRSFSGDCSADRLWMQATDPELVGDGVDATSVDFAVTDKFGNLCPFVGGEVTFRIEGPGAIVGDNPFQLGEAGAGAVWVKTTPAGSGRIRLHASHPSLGHNSVEIEVRRARAT